MAVLEPESSGADQVPVDAAHGAQGEPGAVDALEVPELDQDRGVSGGHLQGTGNAGPLAEHDEQGGGHQGSKDQDGEAGPYQVPFHTGLPAGEERVNYRSLYGVAALFPGSRLRLGPLYYAGLEGLKPQARVP